MQNERLMLTKVLTTSFRLSQETGTEYRESFVEGKKGWLDLQASDKLLFGQVPLLEIDGHNLVQSEACVRYLARKHGMLGASPEESAVVDMVHAATLDIRSGALGVPFQPLEQRVPNLALHVEKVSQKFLLPIDGLIAESPSGFVAGGHISLADITLFESVKFLRDAPYVDHPWLDALPNIKKHYDLIASRWAPLHTISTDHGPVPASPPSLRGFRFLPPGLLLDPDR